MGRDFWMQKATIAGMQYGMEMARWALFGCRWLLGTQHLDAGRKTIVRMQRGRDEMLESRRTFLI